MATKRKTAAKQIGITEDPPKAPRGPRKVRTAPTMADAVSLVDTATPIEATTELAASLAVGKMLPWPSTVRASLDAAVATLNERHPSNVSEFVAVRHGGELYIGLRAKR